MKIKNSFIKKLAGSIIILAFILSILIMFTDLNIVLLEPLVSDDNCLNNDAIVVLGAKVDNDGKPSVSLNERINMGVSLFQKQNSRKIIFAGGKGSNGFVESEVMKKLAISKGIPEENCIAEDQSKTTYENIQNVKTILNGNNLQSVMIITSPFHTYRAKWLMNYFGLKGCVKAVDNSWVEYAEGFLKFTAFYYIMREYTAIVYYKLIY